MTGGSRVALITGGSRGIGAAVARAFVAEGTRVFLVARTAAELRATCDEVETRGGVVACAEADVSDAGAAERAVAACRSLFGRVDVLVNAAATYGPIGPSWETDVAEWASTVAVNLLGTVQMCRLVVPVMIEAGGGRIVNFSGGGATAPLPRFSAYATSKAAVVRFTETLAEELRPYGITVNAIAPGAVDTRLQDEVLNAGTRAGELFDRMVRLRESGEGGVPAELPAALALFLASDVAAGLTGRLISAPHDGWESWDEQRIAELMELPWFTLRRIDEYTLRPLLEQVEKRGAPGTARRA